MRSDKSYSVIQLWIPLTAGDHLLWDQFRSQCGLDELWTAFKHFARRTPSAILVENTAHGPALIERARRFLDIGFCQPRLMAGRESSA